MVNALLALWLGLAPAHAAEPVDADTLALVKTFIKTPTDQLPVEHIGRFLAVDPHALPAKLQRPFVAKRVELYTLKQLADGKKRGNIRMPEEHCSIPKDSQTTSIGILQLAGYAEIFDDEEQFVMEKTQCTEHDLMCEFTLQVILVAGKKKTETQRRLFMHGKDPMMALISQYREMGRVKQTNFFGIGFPTCAPRLKPG